ncbi:hypothetical protein NL676_023369 [Syzygium grande]|nr:hypothetical protein NL676_023369 [Syzygium grande]
MKVYSYAAYNGSDLQVWNIEDFCTITMMTYASDYIPGWEKDRYNPASLTYKDLHNMMAEGFNLSYGGVGASALVKIPSCFLFFRHRRWWCRPYYDAYKSTWHMVLNVALKPAMDLSSVLEKVKTGLESKWLKLRAIKVDGRKRPLKFTAWWPPAMRFGTCEIGICAASNAAFILIPRASIEGQARLLTGTRCGADPATSSDPTKPRGMADSISGSALLIINFKPQARAQLASQT